MSYQDDYAHIYSKKPYLDRKSKLFLKKLENIHDICFSYITEVLHENCGGYPSKGSNVFIQNWSSPCKTEVGTVWIQVYSKNRRAYYAHENLFIPSTLSLREVDFVTDEYTKTRYIVLKNCGSAVLDDI